jgi:diguanylate cyclase (GGDEF)-like protein
MRGDDLRDAYEELVQIGLTFSRETELALLLERVLTEARRFTRAEAGTLYLLEGRVLHFAVVQNDVLDRRLGPAAMRQALRGEPLRLDEPSLAGHVALTGDILNLHDPQTIPPDRPYGFNARIDARLDYETRSVLVVPLPEPAGRILGVLQLINARDARGEIVAFDPRYEGLVRSLARQAAVAIRNTRLESLAIKDGLTEVYNRRYFLARLQEECRRAARKAEPVSLVLLGLDRLRAVNEAGGQEAGDAVLRATARLLLKHSRGFTVVSRFGGDEFVALLPGEAASGAAAYAERLRRVIEQYAFVAGPVTASFGVASLRVGEATADELLRAADAALAEAKRIGGNRVVTG